MKRIIIMLLLACSATVTISAQQKGKQDNVPNNVKAMFSSFLKSWGAPSDEVYSVVKNPNTNQIESSVKITYFVANVNTGSFRQNMSVISEAFKKDEPKAYQLLHLAPTSKEAFSLKVFNENGQNTSYLIRGKEPEEMWLMCCKNQEDPKLRDAYAIKWTYTDDKSKALGAIYQITSLRPDVYERNFESSKKMFKIVGRVDGEIKDSLYNIYIAESREALNNLQDHEYVACVPVVNKRFEWQTELEKPCVGRLRCIFPDGSLCSAWIDLDFVPGETYSITVHNGYYDEDKDYERRVGRLSGKSLIEPDAVKVVDEVPAEYTKANQFDPVEDNFQKWAKSLTEQQKMQLNMRAERIQLTLKTMEEQYQLITKIYNGSNSGYQMDVSFRELLKLNKNLDAKCQDVFKFFKEHNMPKMAYPKGYKEIIGFYTDQLRKLNNYYKQHGAMSKDARKLNSYLLEQSEKYMDAMQKALD